MDEKFYFGIVTKDDDSDYGILFPDFPGCYSAGTDLVELQKMAEDALALHVTALHEEGVTVPEPRIGEDFERAADAYKDESGSVRIMGIPFRPLKGRAVRVQITLDEYLLAEIDRLAANRGETRSGFLASCARAGFETMERF